MSQTNTDPAAAAPATPAASETPASNTATFASETPAPTAQATPAATEPVKADPAPAAKDEGDKGATTTTQEPAKVVPEKYELKVPESSSINQSHLDKISEYAKQKGLSNDEAQALVDREHEVVESFKAHQQEQFTERKNQWLEEVKNDKELGGENISETAILTKRAMDHFASDALKAELDSTGYGNHPELVRMLSKIGKAMSNDNRISSGTGPKTHQSLSSKFYGSSDKQ